MAENAHAAAAMERELYKIPYWYGEASRDSFTAEYWIQRVERIKTAARWNEETTASHALNSLRGRALFFLQHNEILYPSIKTSWTDFKRHFTKAYGVVNRDTSRISNLNVVQAAHEDVRLFGYRVTMTVNEFYCGLPEAREDPSLGDLGGIAATIPHQPAEEAQREANAMAVLAYGSDVAKFYHRRANDIIFRGICKSLFLNGLNATIRTTAKIQKTDTLEEAIEAAITAEQANKGPLDKTVATDPKTVGAIRKRFGGKKNYSSTQSRRSTGPTRRSEECWYCHQRGHVQLQCRKRLSRGAALVPKPRSVQEIQADDLGYQDAEVEYSEAESEGSEDNTPEEEEDFNPDSINDLSLNY